MIITNDIFKKLQEIGEKNCSMPDKMDEIIKKNNALPTEIQYWQKFYTQQKYEVELIKVGLEELYGKLYKHYMLEDDVKWSTSKEIDSQIHADKAYVEEYRKLANQKYYLDYIAETLANLKDMHFTIKNYIEYKKIISTNM